MTNVAKIFIIINFFLSIVYMVVAGTLLAQKWDYKQWLLEKEIEYQQSKKKWETEKQDLGAKVENMKVLVTERTDQAIAAQKNYETQLHENKKLKREIAEHKATVNGFQTELAKLNGYLEKKQTRIKELEDARDEAKQEKEEAIRAKEAAQEEQQNVELVLANTQGELGEKEKLVQRSNKELWEAKQIIRSIRDRGINIPALFKKEPPLDGVITAVSLRKPLVMISIGRDDNVKKGYQFTVYRGDKYVGRVTIEDVYKDAAAARVLKAMTVKKIRKGDKVTTRIGSTSGGS